MLKIAMMSRWNATCGVSTHAELVGREWVEMGHELTVLAPRDFGNTWHHQRVDEEDEDYVLRCYEEGGSVDKEAMLSTEFDVFVFQGLKMLPVDELEDLVPVLKERGAVVAVVHHDCEEEVEALYRLDPDAIVVFDERYLEEVVPSELRDRCAIVPYPCFKGFDVEPRRPEFAEDKLLFFSFGKQPPYEYGDYVRVLKRLTRKYDLVYWVLKSYWTLPWSYPWLVREKGNPPLRRIYEYLRGADIHLIPKWPTRRVVVSSTLNSTLASGCPTVVPDTRHFETVPEDEEGAGPVVRYRSCEELEERLTRLIEDEEFRQRVISYAESFVEEYRSDRVAAMFVDLFEALLSEVAVSEWSRTRVLARRAE